MLRTQAVPARTSNLIVALSQAADTLFLWQGRARQRRQLAGLDARLLRDMGISRGEALAEASKPFWQA